MNRSDFISPAGFAVIRIGKRVLKSPRPMTMKKLEGMARQMVQNNKLDADLVSLCLGNSYELVAILEYYAECQFLKPREFYA